MKRHLDVLLFASLPFLGALLAAASLIHGAPR